MSCRKIRRSLSRYYRGELSKDEEELIIRHIQLCESCAREAQRYKALNQAIQGLEVFTTSPDFEAKLEEKIREIPYMEEKPERKRLFTSFPSLRWVFVPAIVAVIVLFFILKGGFYKSNNSIPSKETALVEETTPSDTSKDIPLLTEESKLGENKGRAISVASPGVREENPRAVFVIDNLRHRDLEKMPDSRILERKFTNFVMDAVRSKVVDDRGSSEGYVLPAVSNSSTKVKISY